MHCQIIMIIVFILVLIECLITVRGQDLTSINLVGLLPMTGKGWVGGKACLPAISMALRHINAREGLLDGYNLTYHWDDTQCNPGLATYQLFQQLAEEPAKHMVLGCGCSIATEATAQVSHLWNLSQLSFGSASPILSDRTRFPRVFRLAGPDSMVNAARIALMEKYNWKRVATINQALEYFSMVIDDFVKRVKDTDITIISQEIFATDPTTRVENLKARDARIIMTACYEYMARKLLCSAYNVGLYGPRFVWIFPAWYRNDFWKVRDVTCSLDQMEAAADGIFLTDHYYWNLDDDVKGVAGLNVPEFMSLYRDDELYDPTTSAFDFVAGNCYDHIWVAALALNCTDAYLKQTGHPKTLAQFTYGDSDIGDVTFRCMTETDMIGVSGSIVFESGVDPIRNMRIERIQDGARKSICMYRRDTGSSHGRLECNGEEIKWKGGHVPHDSTYVTMQEVHIPPALSVTMGTLAALGICIAVAFFTFNVYHRNNRTIKMSSPNINSVLLMGCILMYSTVFMNNTAASGALICKLRSICFALGFTISFGAMFAKTWRVYRIFTNKNLLKRAIKDYQLMGIICLLSGVVMCVLVVWQIVGPFTMVIETLDKEVYMSSHDVEVHPFVRMCFSEYSNYFGWTLYIIEGALLAFGAFLSWETRHVKIAALNDSHEIGMCVYNVIILSAVGLTLSVLLEKQVVMVYGVTSGCIIIGTTVTQAIVFVPKMQSVYQGTILPQSRVHAAGMENNTKPSSSKPPTVASNVGKDVQQSTSK